MRRLAVNRQPAKRPIMSADSASAAPVARKQRNPDSMGAAGGTPDPWVECARLEYGGDRSHATVVRSQVTGRPAADRGRIEEQLLKTLEAPGRTDAGLAFLCEMFALVGSAKAVPALAPLLRDAKTTDVARYALEAIPGAEAAAALRDALPSLSGAAKAGLIGSIVVRGDTSARAALAALKDATNEPAVVRDAAARALESLAGRT